MSRESEIKRQIQDSIDITGYLQMQVEVLQAIADRFVQAFRSGNKVLLFGNGGSAADAQHIAAELAGKLYIDRPPLPAIALTINSSSLTAISNDYSYEIVFARQVAGLVSKGDVVVGISTSGDSPSVLMGIEEARCHGATTIAFTGGGGKLKDRADHVLSVPSQDTPRIQEAHITAGHVICYLVEEMLFGGDNT